MNHATHDNSALTQHRLDTDVLSTTEMGAK